MKSNPVDNLALVLQIISLQIDEEQVSKLKVIAEDKDMSVSALIRMMIKQYLKEHKNEVQLSSN